MLDTCMIWALLTKCEGARAPIVAGVVTVGYIAEDLSPENKRRDGHQQNESAILKYLGVASNGLKSMQD